ncbi:MAG: amidohydrolase [Chloroflexi bacterium]|nr:amidohydrolase [Chloroflexota bacterium]
MAKRLALINGDVVTLETRQPRAQAVLAVDGRIALVGSDAEVLAARQGGEVMDLHGRALLPGFGDSHVHLMATGIASVGLQLQECRSLGEVLALVRQAARRETLVRGLGFDPTVLVENRFPTRAELDEAASGVPTYLARRDLHAAVLNSSALALVRAAEGEQGYERDPLGGEPTGVLRAEAWYKASSLLFAAVDENTWRRALHTAARQALAVGATTVHALEGGFTSGDVDLGALSDYLAEPGEARLKIVLWWQTKEVARVAAAGLPRIGGCLLVDGSFGSHTAALAEPYADRPDWNGVLYQSDEELADFVMEAHRAGLQIALHAIGDRAIGQALNAYRRALAAYPRPGHRHRLEHFMLPTAEQIVAAGELGIHVAVQPTFCQQWGGEGGMYYQRLGPERYARFYPLQTMLQAGLTLGGGSDSTVTPLQPLLGMHAAVNRAEAEQRLTPAQALSMYTLDAARLAFEEQAKGSIAPGKAADLVVLGANPLRVPPGEIAAIPVEATFVDGQQVWP